MIPFAFKFNILAMPLDIYDIIYSHKFNLRGAVFGICDLSVENIQLFGMLNSYFIPELASFCGTSILIF